MRTYYILFIYIFIISCKNIDEIKENENCINIEKAFKEKKKISASDLFEKAYLLPLETTENSLIGANPNIQIIDSLIFVSSKGQELKVFNKNNGKYLRSIGSIGNGQKEYTDDGLGNITYYIDSEHKLIYIPRWNQSFQIYNFEGNYIQNKKIKITGECFSSIHLYKLLIKGNELWGHLKHHNKNPSYQVFKYNLKTNQVINTIAYNGEAYPSPEEVVSSFLIYGEEANLFFGGTVSIDTYKRDKKSYSILDSPSIWCFNDEVFLFENFQNSIYKIKGDSLISTFSIKLGEFNLDYNNRMRVDESRNKIVINYILENEKYLYIHFMKDFYERKKRKYYCAFFEKETKEVIVSNLKRGKIKNDILNLPNFKIYGVSSSGDFYTLYYPDAIKNWAEKYNHKVANLDVEANPTVVFFK